MHRRAAALGVRPAGIILGLLGLCDIVYQGRIVIELRRVDIASLDWADWFFYSVMAILCDASLIAGAGGLIGEKPFALYAIAGAVTLQLIAGIYGAWSITLWIARSLDKRNN